MYGVVVLIELLIQQIGWAFNTLADPLASGLVTGVTGALVIWGGTVWLTRKALPFRSLTPYDRVVVGRLAFGLAVINVGYPYGSQLVGMGAIITMSALGPLCSNGRVLWTIFRHPAEAPAGVLRGAVWSVVFRVAAFAGVVVVNEPWNGFEHSPWETGIGIVCGLLGAWSFWNYLHCLYDEEHYPKAVDRLRILAVADLVAIPLTALAVWGASLGLGGGFSELSSGKVLLLGTGAGILSFAVPTFIGAWVSGKVSLHVSSLLYLLDSPMGCLIGFIGAALGVLGAVQAPGPLVWVGMGVVFLAALAAARRPIPKVQWSKDEHCFISPKGAPA
ncbi:hypothetical protein GCM10023088_13720 [Actinomadura verrucosospora]|uniref:hypothetical protein n=1 Tax=Actinomadura TaxID=1988 RepID=UPI0031EEBED8